MELGPALRRLPWGTGAAGRVPQGRVSGCSGAPWGTEGESPLCCRAPGVPARTDTLLAIKWVEGGPVRDTPLGNSGT